MDYRGVLRERDELVGRQQSQGGVPPADKGLDAGQLAGARAYLGLVVHGQLAGGDASAQVAEADETGEIIVVARRLVAGEGVVSGLGLVHGYIGVTQKCLHVVAGFGERDPDAGVDVERDVLHRERFVQGGIDALRGR
jgi:hypothetical protein